MTGPGPRAAPRLLVPDAADSEAPSYPDPFKQGQAPAKRPRPDPNCSERLVVKPSSPDPKSSTAPSGRARAPEPRHHTPLHTLQPHIIRPKTPSYAQTEDLHPHQ